MTYKIEDIFSSNKVIEALENVEQSILKKVSTANINFINDENSSKPITISLNK